MGKITVRILIEGEEGLLQTFLLPRLDSSMLLFSNIQARGLAYKGQRYEGTYAAAFDGSELIGVVAHYWNQNIILQASTHLKELLTTVVRASDRPIGGLLGPDEQVQESKEILGFSQTNLRHDEVEKLYSLKLRDLIVPELLATGHATGRLANNNDIDLLAKWRMAYLKETLAEQETPDLAISNRQSIAANIAEHRTWVVECKREVVATSSFNASVQHSAGVGIVQVGGVWTPPDLRRKGFGRTAVATSLVDARDSDVKNAVLFTGEGNVAAQKAYLALGFVHVGAYRLTFLHHPMSW